MRVIALFRVSTERQATDGASLDAQQRIYRDLASRSGWVTLGEFRGCESAAQAAADRQVLQGVLKAVREEGPDAIYVHEQSRLTRGDDLDVALLLRELKDRRCKIIVGGAIRDMNSVDERFMVGIQGLVDRAEYERIRERVMRCKRERALQGRKNTGAPPLGFRNPPPGSPDRGRLQVVPEEASVVQKIFELAASGLGARTISARLNAEAIAAPRGGTWGATSIKRIVANPAYVGVHVSGGWIAEPGRRTFRFDPKNPKAIVIDGAYPAIISKNLWDKVHSRPKLPRTARPRLLTGMLYVNGMRASGDTSDGRSYYRARGVQTKVPWLETSLTDEAVWRAFRTVITQPDLLTTLVKKVGGESDAEKSIAKQKRLDAEAKKHHKRLGALVTMRADGDIDREQFRSATEATRTALVEVERELNAIRSRMHASDPSTIQAAVSTLRVILGSGTLLTQAQQRSLLLSVVQKINITAVPGDWRQSRERSRFSKASGCRWRLRDVSLSLSLPIPTQQAEDGTTDRSRDFDTASICCARPPPRWSGLA